MTRLIMALASLSLTLAALGQTRTYDDNKFAFDYPEDMTLTANGDYQTRKDIHLKQEGCGDSASIYIAPGGAFPAEIDKALERNMNLFAQKGYNVLQTTFVTDELEHECVKYFDYEYADGLKTFHRVAVVENPNYDIIILLSAADRKDVCHLYRDIVATFRPGDYYPAQMEIERYNMDFIINSEPPAKSH